MTMHAHSTADTLAAARRSLEIALPEPGLRFEQDEEWLLALIGDEWRRVRVHDYDTLYSVPGLYERVVYDIFQCRSPQKLRRLLGAALREDGVRPETLRVLDLGAGNGYVAEEFGKLGIRRFVGVDLLEEAALAAERDRPGAYDDYAVGDITDLPLSEEEKLDRHNFNTLTCVAALGFGDIPPEVFAAAFNRVSDGGWIAFTIKADFVDEGDDDSGFARLIRHMLRDGVMDLRAREPFTHRVSTSGDGLEYVAFVGRKRRDIREDEVAG